MLRDGGGRRRHALGGEQRCSRGAADATPGLLLLDEPSLGLAPLSYARSSRFSERSIRPGSASCSSSRNAALALDLADHVFLLETGRVVMEGPSDICARTSDPRAYLGSEWNLHPARCSGLPRRIYASWRPG